MSSTIRCRWCAGEIDHLPHESCPSAPLAEARAVWERLTFAAPDLLEALRQAQQLLCGLCCKPGTERHTNACNDARAAIAKATGGDL